MDEELNTMFANLEVCVCAHLSWEGLTLQQGKAGKYNSRSVLKKALYGTSAGLGLKDKSSKGPIFAKTGAIVIADWKEKKEQTCVPCPLFISFYCILCPLRRKLLSEHMHSYETHCIL